MPDSMMYQEDGFVVLEAEQPETFLTHEELLNKLYGILVDLGDDLPKELIKFTTLEEKAKYLRDNFCELDRPSGKYLRWFVVRLEK